MASRAHRLSSEAPVCSLLGEGARLCDYSLSYSEILCRQMLGKREEIFLVLVISKPWHFFCLFVCFK